MIVAGTGAAATAATSIPEITDQIEAGSMEITDILRCPHHSHVRGTIHIDNNNRMNKNSINYVKTDSSMLPRHSYHQDSQAVGETKSLILA